MLLIANVNFFHLFFASIIAFAQSKVFFLESDGRKRHKFTNFLFWGGFNWTLSERCLPSTSETAASSSSTKTFKQTNITQRETKYRNCVFVLKARFFSFSRTSRFFVAVQFLSGSWILNIILVRQKHSIYVVDFVRSVEQSSKRNEA